ncbi:hypothetical protein [Sinorhizobium chiapasense]|uniref:Uncharacterized protein n=1 Tax=Sinorhizobium chiapasense TaxID=501572 RepID=A0ABZ2BJF0_9HYPH
MYSMTGQRRYRPLLRLIGSSQIIQDSRNTVFQDLLADHRNGSKFAGALERRDKRPRRVQAQALGGVTSECKQPLKDMLVQFSLMW